MTNMNSIKDSSNLYEVFASLGQQLSAVKTPKEAASVILDIADSLFKWDSCYLNKYSKDDDQITEIVVIDTIDGRKVEIPARDLVSKPGKMFRVVFDKGAQLILRNKNKDDAREKLLTSFGNKSKKSSSLMYVPIRKGSQCVGMLSIQSYSNDAYSNKDLEMLQVLADFCSGALERTFAETQLFDLKKDYNMLKKMVFSEKLEHPEAFQDIVTNSPIMKSVFLYTERIAKTSKPVLITGETGVGKELIARAIHKISGRKGKLISINIAGLDDNVLSDALFGHRKGAFTSAHESRAGLIEEAVDGTLFLDEIGDLGMASQVKLLRLLQENEYFRIGEDKPRKSNARIIVSTNHNLHELMNAGKFRKDLYFRLQIHQILIPPLKKRIDDLNLLIDHFLEKAAAALDKKKPAVPDELAEHLATYSFPGNIRELESIIFDAVSSHKSGIISLKSFENYSKRNTAGNQNSSGGNIITSFDFPEDLPTLKAMTDIMIAEALKRANGNQNLAARLLGISPPALCRRLKRTGKQKKSGIS